jgi:hypothetical protein
MQNTKRHKKIGQALMQATWELDNSGARLELEAEGFFWP